MLYATREIPPYNTRDAMTVKVAKQGLKKGAEIPVYTAISEGDIATVMFMYR